jgi:hypothetical protein
MRYARSLCLSWAPVLICLSPRGRSLLYEDTISKLIVNTASKNWLRTSALTRQFGRGSRSKPAWLQNSKKARGQITSASAGLAATRCTPAGAGRVAGRNQILVRPKIARRKCPAGVLQHFAIVVLADDSAERPWVLDRAEHHYVCAKLYRIGKRPRPLLEPHVAAGDP